jgi:alkanesulfonate monooxygenase SsuD/methylene tetrahydromethanopterin reductase-like flavin-dependent oxidoreductase (luciferase family)
MRFGLSIGNFAEWADPRLVAATAKDAEEAGWDGVFVWDHLVFVKAWRLPVGDPWTMLAAIGLATDRIRLGPMVTPLPRRRPQMVARQAATLDRLTRGRFVLGVGLGEPAVDEFGTFGEPEDRATRAAMLDEGLDVLAALWSGEPVTHRGRFYTVEDATFLPTPVQTPRIPVWVAATLGRDRPVVRAARWDGIHPVKYADDGSDVPFTPDDIAGLRARIGALRADASLTLDGYEVVVGGELTEAVRRAQAAACRELADAGATWWLHTVTPRGGSVDDHRAIVRVGPPR